MLKSASRIQKNQNLRHEALFFPPHHGIEQSFGTQNVEPTWEEKL